MKVINQFSYFDQVAFQGSYCAVARDLLGNGNIFGVHSFRTGCDPLENSLEMTTASTEAEAIEIAYRLAHDLPIRRVLFCGVEWNGISEKSAIIWISKNKKKYSSKYELSVIPFKDGRFQVEGVPINWLKLDITH